LSSAGLLGAKNKIIFERGSNKGGGRRGERKVFVGGRGEISSGRTTK